MKKKILLIAVGIISGLLFKIGDVKALRNDTTLETKYTGVWGYHYKGGNLVTYGGLPFRYLNGKLGYCIEPTKPITVHTYSSYGDWSLTGYDENVKHQMELIAYYGYEYPGHNTLEYYMATQELIWLYNDDKVIFRKSSNINSEIINVDREKEEIMNLVNNHDKLPSFINTSYNELYGKKVSIVDENNVLDNYDINSNISYKKNGNVIDFTVDKFGKNDITFNQKCRSNDLTTVFIAEGYNSQKMVILGKPRLNSGNISITSDKVKIEFTKRDNDSKNIIKDKKTEYKLINKDTKKETIIEIGKSGIYELDVKDGNYILEETKAPYGYSINKEKIDIVIDNNINLNDEKLKIDLYDKVVKGKINIIKVDEYNNNLQGVVIGIYDDKYNLIEKIMTKSDIKNESKLLPLGKYYVKEISTLEGYELDNHYHEIELKYKNQTESIVVNDLKIINKKIRCDIVYITSDNDGKKLKDVEINVFDKDGNIVFNGKTDTNGEVVINGLPYGEYYIKQIKVPSGYLLNEDEFKFYVNDSTCSSKINVTNEKTIMPVTSKQTSLYLVSCFIILGIGVYNFVKKDS